MIYYADYLVDNHRRLNNKLKGNNPEQLLRTIKNWAKADMLYKGEKNVWYWVWSETIEGETDLIHEGYIEVNRAGETEEHVTMLNKVMFPV